MLSSEPLLVMTKGITACNGSPVIVPAMLSTCLMWKLEAKCAPDV